MIFIIILFLLFVITIYASFKRWQVTRILALWSIIILVPIIVITCFVLFPEKPATHEKILEVLDHELENKIIKNDIKYYIALIELFNVNKIQIIDSLSKSNPKKCFEILLNKDVNHNQNHFPKNIIINYLPIISKIKTQSLHLHICQDKSMYLSAVRTDYENYLNITHIFYKNGDHKISKLNANYGIHRQKSINKKYNLNVSIFDAFNQIDPNNFAPN